MSIKRNADSTMPQTLRQNLDGGLTMTNLAPSLLMAQAFSDFVPWEMIGLPDWARPERYDIIATGIQTFPVPHDSSAARCCGACSLNAST